MTLPRLSLGIALGAVVADFAAALYLLGRPGFPLDDAWIHLRLARSLAAGEGLSYGDGWVGASTAPLWTGLLSLPMAPFASLPASHEAPRPDGLETPLAMLWSLGLGVAALLALVVATAALGHALGLPRRWAGVAAAFVASSHWLVWSALSGMEITLFAALATAGLATHARERDAGHRTPRAPALLALACLARPEGLLPLVLVLIDRTVGDRLLGERRRGRRDPGAAWAWGTTALVLGPTALVYAVLGGSALPTTLAAKSTKSSLAVDPAAALELLRLVGGLLLGSFPLLAPLAVIGLWRLLARPTGRVVGLWLIGQPLAYALLADAGSPPMGNFGRYHFPLFPLLVVAATLGLHRLVGDARRPVALAALILVAAPQALLLSLSPARYAQTVANVEDSDVRAALWLRDRLPDDAVLATQDIGAVGYFLPDHRLVDLAGIIDPEIRAVLRDDAAGRYWEERLVEALARRPPEARPDVMVVFAESYPAIASSPRFPRVATFEVADNVTMAGSTLVVLRTPWSRHRLEDPLDAR